ncbi:hypothetical protein [Cellulomonas palmilytica]|uniref:hypothetical protein n=1 Tax=Cellulomonas palmilytica TaxID=2608402 RepID=UPI001F3D3507|nr:hypothetical protein [Cellulomonas palmilytica]UJP40005.1 hypothetical protein F1D97_00075 [Cellulomonas palmilytica]
MLYKFEPPVLGQLVKPTTFDNSTWPPTVAHVTYEFDSYRGQDVVATFPVVLVRSRLRDALVAAGLTGLSFEPVAVTAADHYDDLSPDVALPVDWLRMHLGAIGDDAWRGEPHGITVPDTFVEVVRQFGIVGSTLTPLRG